MATVEKDPVTIERKVLEAYTRDVGRSIVRMDYNTMDEMNVGTGDVILLESLKNKVGAKALPLYPSDEGKSIVRIDGLLRENLATKIALPIKLTRIESPTADEVVVAPLKEIPPIDARYLADALESIPILNGNIALIPYFGGRIRFKVIKTKPDGIVVVSERTKFTILKENYPSEVLDYEKAIVKEKNDLLKATKSELTKALKSKDYKKVKEITDEYNEKIGAVERSFSAAKSILSKEEWEEEE